MHILLLWDEGPEPWGLMEMLVVGSAPADGRGRRHDTLILLPAQLACPHGPLSGSQDSKSEPYFTP